MGSPLRMGTEFFNPNPMVLHMHPEVPNGRNWTLVLFCFPRSPRRLQVVKCGVSGFKVGSAKKPPRRSARGYC